MKVELSDSLTAYIRQKVESGQYENTSKLLEEAFHLLDVRDATLEEEREAIREGFAQIERGKFIYLDELDTEALLQSAIAAARARRSAEQTLKAS